MNEGIKKHLSLKRIIIAAAVLIIYTLVFFFSFTQMKRSFYEERAASAERLMEKINQTVGVGVDKCWTNIRHFASLFDRYGVKDMQMALTQIANMRETSPEEISRVFLVDSEGICYVSDGTRFNIADRELLASDGKEEFYISGADFSVDTSDTTPHMYFLSRLSRTKLVDGISITHIGLSCEMTFLDLYFDTSDYGSESLALIIRSDGAEIYRQEKDTTVSDMGNLFLALEGASFNYGVSFQDFKADMQEDGSGCVNIDYNGGNYYLVYQKLRTKDWSSVLMIPADRIDSATEGYVSSIILNTVFVVVGAAAVLMMFLISAHRSQTRKKDELNKKLSEAAEAERNANLAKTQFLSSMSHDIRTPMNAIIGMTALASKHIDDAQYVKNCLSKVTLASNHLLTLINDVLDISKVESGRMMLNPIVFSLAETSRNLVNIVKQQISAKRQKFEVRVHNITHEYLFADELRLNQIFINILTNAVKYTDVGGSVTLDLMEEQISSEKVRIIYIVEDSGIGMSEEFMQTMYDAFARANGENVGNVQGTGLGLAICRQMVNLMGGTIECESRVGVGTKFTVKLDLQIAERVGDELMLPPMHVLLVDDDEIFLETASDTLESLGLTLDTASSGEAALSAVKERHNSKNQYPAVIIDWQLPGIDGIETTRRIRAEVGDEVPIIVISAYDRAELEEAAIAAGANGFISKPFFPSSVYRDMSEILGINKKGKEEAATEDSTVSLHGVKILIAEDNDLNWEIAREVLSMYGAEAVRAEDGLRCVEEAEGSYDGEYRLILMDIQMPNMNGYEATKALRSSEREYVRKLPIIAMTADAFADDIQRCLAVGMNAHIAKPINIANLLSVIGSFAKR